MPNDPQEQQQANTVRMAGEITVLLRRLSHGDVAVISSVMTPLYSDLKRIAEGRMRWERIDHTLQPAALVNELFLQFAKNPAVRWESRKHFHHRLPLRSHCQSSAGQFLSDKVA